LLAIAPKLYEKKRASKRSAWAETKTNSINKTQQQAGLLCGCMLEASAAATSHVASFGCPGPKHFEENGFGELRTGGSCLNRNENGRFLFDFKQERAVLV